MKFTGERYIPSLDWAQLSFEHWHRYFFASAFAAGKSVLDVACGVGYGSDLLARTAARVVGVDIDAETIVHASATYVRGNLQFLRGDSASIPVEGEALFDLAVSFETIEHLEADAQAAFMREIKRLLKPGGLLLISTPNKAVYSEMDGNRNTFHRREFHLSEFQAFLQAQFKNVTLCGQKVYPASHIWDLAAASAGPFAEYGLEFSDGEYRPAARGKDVLYAIALCSDAEALAGGHSVLLDISEKFQGRIRELERHIAATERYIQSMSQQQADVAGLRRERDEALGRLSQLRGDPIESRLAHLETLEKSVSWRIMRRVQALMDGVLFPPGTPRGRIYQRFLTARGPATPPPAAKPPSAAAIAAPAAGTAPTATPAGTDVGALSFPPTAAPRVSIVIPVYNQCHLTRSCLRSVLANTEGAYEVIVVDDGSTDATPQLLEATEHITRIRSEVNRGFLLTCNEGWKQARGEWVLFLNNDTEVSPGWLQPLIDIMERHLDAGAASPKLLWPDGRLMEAGSIIWSDGLTDGYGRDADPAHPAFNYVRDLDYASASCLLVRRNLLERLGGFDAGFAPAYFEDTDLCMGIRRLGYRILYQPESHVAHRENGSTTSAAARDLMLAHRDRFARKWKAELRTQPARTAGTLRARDARPGKRVLVLDDAVPVADLGSGYPRALQRLHALAELGYVCTVFPLLDLSASEADTRELRQMGIEVFSGGYAKLEEFMEERRGLYDLVIVSRPNNAARVMTALKALQPQAGIVYDAEALYADREALKFELAGTPQDPAERERRLREELASFEQADAFLTVSALDQAALEKRGLSPVHVWGTPAAVREPERPFDARRDLLFVGGFLTPGCPNEDAATWLVREILPRVRAHLDVRLVIAGTNRLDSVRALASDHVTVAGHVDDLGPLFESARVFVAPTRFAAGSPQKLHDAMRHGLPVVATPLLARQLGLADGHALLTGADADEFAARIVTLYRDPELWKRLQDQELSYVRRHCDPDQLTRDLDRVLRAVLMDEAELPARVQRLFPVRAPPAERSLLVRMDLTNNCNLVCRQCTLRQSRRNRGETPGEMDLELFRRIVQQVFPYAATVALSCEAEPTLHSRFLEVCRILADHPGPLYKMTTNAQLLDEEKVQAIFDARIGEIYLSIDGATPATYEHIRQRGRFDGLIRGIEHLLRAKEKRGAGRRDAPVLHVNYTLMASTLPELPRMVEWCRTWNVDRLVLQHIYGLDLNGMGDESLIHQQDASDAMLAECRAKCEEYGIRTLFPLPFRTGGEMAAGAPARDPEEALHCYAPWRMVRIRWNGGVYPCDLWSGEIIGDLRAHSFADIWNSPAYRRLRWGHATRAASHPSCRRCDMVTTENIEGLDRQIPVVNTPRGRLDLKGGAVTP